MEFPFRQPDADIELPLANVFTTVYDNGAYDIQLDYAKPVPPPPLPARQQAWVDQLIERTT